MEDWLEDDDESLEAVDEERFLRATPTSAAAGGGGGSMPWFRRDFRLFVELMMVERAMAARKGYSVVCLVVFVHQSQLCGSRNATFCVEKMNFEPFFSASKPKIAPLSFCGQTGRRRRASFIYLKSR